MSAAHPLISVVVPVYNGESCIAQAVRSVLAQDYPAVEIIVVDDGSTDGTVAALQPFADRVRLLRQANSGVASARNAGMRAANGQWIAFLDADDWWLPSRLTTQIRACERYPDSAMVFADFSVVTSGGHLMRERGIRWKYRSVSDPRVASWAKIFERSDKLPATPGSADASPVDIYSGSILEFLFEGNFINTSSVLLRRDVAARVGAFDAGLETEEDYDYWLRVAAEWPMTYIDAPLVVFRKSPGQLTRPDQIGRIVANALRVVESAGRRFPNRISAQRLSRRRSAMQTTLGIIALRERRRDQARALFRRAIFGGGRCLRPGIFYLLAWVPIDLFGLLGRIRRRE